MEKNKRTINILLVVVVVLITVMCIIAYVFFTKEKTKPIINPEEKKEIQNQEKIFSVENYPKIDGSIATLPLAEAFKANFTGENINDINVTYSENHEAYVNLIKGDADLILVTAPTEEEEKLAKEKDIELEAIPIAKEAFVFFTNTENPVGNLTTEQIQHIYAGKIRNWRELGGENEKILAYQRPEKSESQTGMVSLVMKGKRMIDPITEDVNYNGENVVGVIADYKNQKSAIGYSYYKYVLTMYTVNKMKLFAVDGVEPTYENIQTGLYGLQTSYYAVIRKSEEQNSEARKLLNAMKSERGQNVVKEAGYVQNY